LLYIKKQVKFTLVICISLIFVIGSLFQLLPTNPFGNSYGILIKIPLIYADHYWKDDKDYDDCKDDKDDNGRHIDDENGQDTNNESFGNVNEDTVKNLNTDNNDGEASIPTEDSYTPPSPPPYSTTRL